MQRAILSTLLATSILTTPLLASNLSGSRPGTYLPQVTGNFTPNVEFRPVLAGLRHWVSNHCEANAEVMEVYDRLILAMGRQGAFNDRSHLQTIDAIFCAAEKHEHRVHQSPPFTPYVVHPMGLALILWEEGGVRDPDILAAALLREATGAEVKQRFGQQVWAYLNDPSLAAAKQIEMADKLYSLRQLAARTPVEFNDREMTPWSEERIGAYFAQANADLAALRGVNGALEKQLDSLLATS